MPWTFTPFSPADWGTAPTPNPRGPRVLLVGSEPNGGNPHGAPDMGDWFRRAHADARRLGNTRFYTGSVRQLALLTGARAPDLRWLRYGDLKATPGGAKSDLREVTAWVRAHLDEVLRFWLPRDGDPGAPDVTVLQGSVAQAVFVAELLPRLRARGVASRFVGLAHPSSMTAQDMLDPDAVAASARPLQDGFGAWRYQQKAWRWVPLDTPRWSAPVPVPMPGRALRAFVATLPEQVPARGPFASVDGSVPGAAATWDHHVTGERINLDAMPPVIDPRAFLAVGTTLADTDALASVVALRAGGEAALPPEVRLVLRAASERCDHLVARAGVPPELQRAADALHRHVEQTLAAAPDGARSDTFARLCDEVTVALAHRTPLPAAGADPHVGGLQRRILREGRRHVHGRVARIDVRGMPELPADALHALHDAPVAVVVREHPRGGVAYTVGVNPATAAPDLDLLPALEALAAREFALGSPCVRPTPGPGSENWGGRRTVFGSPWNHGSRISPEEVAACVEAALPPRLSGTHTERRPSA